MKYTPNALAGGKSEFVRKGFKVVAITALLLTGTIVADAKPSQECNWYLSAGAQGIVGANGSGPDVDFGNQVVVNGSSRYDGDHAVNLAAGREFMVCNEKGRPVHLRLELQYLDGIVGRNSVNIGVVNPRLDDKVDIRALFLNGFIRIARTDHFRLWFGPGIGYSWTDFPDASYATACGCLKPAKSDGLAFQVKLQGERMVSEKTSIFGEMGYANFKGAGSGGVPSARYGDIGMVTIGLGIITQL